MADGVCVSPTASKAELISDQIRELFITSTMPTAALPSERKLAERFGVARMTVRAALKLLEADGSIRSAPGAAYMVLPPQVTKGQKLSSFTEDALARGWVPGARLIEQTTIPADDRLAATLGIDPGTMVHRIARVRTADGTPLSYELVHLPASYAPGLVDEDLTGSLYALLAERYDIRITRHERVIKAVNLDARQAGLLGVEAGTAALHVPHIGYDQFGRRVEHVDALYCGDRYEFSSMTYLRD